MTKSMLSLVAIVCGLVCLGLSGGSQRAAAEYPPVPTTETLAPVAAHLTCHYIEQLPTKPKTNKQLLLEYVRAYKNIEKALGEADKSKYEIELVGFNTLSAAD